MWSGGVGCWGGDVSCFASPPLISRQLSRQVGSPPLRALPPSPSSRRRPSHPRHPARHRRGRRSAPPSPRRPSYRFPPWHPQALLPQRRRHRLSGCENCKRLEGKRRGGRGRDVHAADSHMVDAAPRSIPATMATLPTAVSATPPGSEKVAAVP